MLHVHSWKLLPELLVPDQFVVVVAVVVVAVLLLLRVAAVVTAGRSTSRAVAGLILVS